MDRIVYTAGSGASRTLEHQAVVSNNMANASTAGFRAQLAQYRSVPVVGDGLPTRVGTVAVTPSADFTVGPMQTTGRAMDIAVQGDGWLSVFTPEGEAFTRAGNLHVGVDGVLKNAQGMALMSEDNQPIAVPDNAQLSFGADGTITALGAGDEPNAVALLGRLKLVNPDPQAIVRGDDGLFRLQAPEGGQPALAVMDPNVRITDGTLEGSNVNPMEAMVAMINNGRRFEMQMKVIQHANSNAERANQLLAAGQ